MRFPTSITGTMTDLTKMTTAPAPASEDKYDTMSVTETETEPETKPTVPMDYPHSGWYYDSAGHLEIVSSDGTLLKLAAYSCRPHRELLPALSDPADKVSSVFREMIKWDNGGFQRIILHDQELETVSVLHGLLDTMTKHSNILDLCIRPKHPSTRRQLVIRLAQKYRCVGESQAIKLRLEVGLYVKNRNPWSIFEMAVRLGDLQLCTDAIKKASLWSRDDKAAVKGTGGSFGDALLGEGSFDIRSYSLEAMKALPIEAIWALSRASHTYIEHTAESKRRLMKNWRRGTRS
jgi:hypothetical protein